MRAVPPGGKQRRGGAPSFKGVRRRDWKEPLTIQVRFRGGSEAWWFVEARGCQQAFPGHMSIHDVMAVVTGWYNGHQRGPDGSVE